MASRLTQNSGEQLASGDGSLERSAGGLVALSAMVNPTVADSPHRSPIIHASAAKAGGRCVLTSQAEVRRPLGDSSSLRESLSKSVTDVVLIAP